jgi:uncharacterized protein (DUF1778 family)
MNEKVRITLRVPKSMRDALRHIAAHENLEDHDWVITANDVAIEAIHQFLIEFFEE